MAIDMSALYVQLHPDCELAEGEQYSVNLLALVPVAKKEKLEEVRQGVTALDILMRSVGMDVRSVVKLENSFVCLGARVSPFSPGTSFLAGRASRPDADCPIRSIRKNWPPQGYAVGVGRDRKRSGRPRAKGAASTQANVGSLMIFQVLYVFTNWEALSGYRAVCQIRLLRQVGYGITPS